MYKFPIYKKGGPILPKCHGVDEKIAKITDKETQQTNVEVRPTTSAIAETPLKNIAERTTSSKRIGDYAEDVEQVEGDGIVMFCIGVMTKIFSIVCCPDASKNELNWRTFSRKNKFLQSPSS